MKSNGSLLSALNPSAKLFSHLLVMCILMFVSNPKPTFFIWLFAVVIGIFFGGWTLSYLSKRLLPYLIFFILVFWMMAAFGKGEETIWEWAWFRVTEESVGNGLTIALRMLGFVTYGLLFTSTTDLTQFIMSLIHQCRLSPKWAYGLLAGFRFVPLFQSELSQMKAAHKIRGYKQKTAGRRLFAMRCRCFRKASANRKESPLPWKREGLPVQKTAPTIKQRGFPEKTSYILRVWHQSQRGFCSLFKKVFYRAALRLFFYKPGYRRAFCKMQTFRTLTEIY